jgi:outer membrane protein assembly factor BamB
MDKQGDDERVVCLDAGTGKELWAHRYRVDYSAFQLRQATGPRATPTVAGGKVFTVGATGVFLCLEAAPRDGRAHVLWQHNLMEKFDATPPGWGVACSPLVEGNLVYVQPGGTKGSVAAFDTRTGDVAWTALSDVSGYSSPMAATVAGVRQILCFTGKGLAGLQPADGKQLWYFPWATQHDANIATPVIAGNYVFISSGYNAGCALLEVYADGHSVSAEPVYVKRNKLMRNHHSSCVLYRGYLYGFDDNIFKCVDIRTGEEKWASRQPGKGAVLAADGSLLVLTEQGSLALVEASPEGFHEKGQVRDVLGGSDCWALPALAERRLYLRDQQHVLCLDLNKH